MRRRQKTHLGVGLVVGDRVVGLLDGAGVFLQVVSLKQTCPAFKIFVIVK